MELFCQKSARLLIAILIPLTIVGPLHAEPNLLRHSRQCLLVLTPDWKSQSGNLFCFERRKTSEGWRQRGGVVQVVVGKAGLGRGRFISGEGPIKREGDGRAPAGIFALGPAFGYANEARWLKLPYRPLSSNTEAIDDPHSLYYNQLVERTEVAAPDWRSSEHMRRADDCYKWGVVVDYNVNPVEPGAGSCIFLHIWRGPQHPTVGCTAMAEPDLLALLRWLDPDSKPVIIQLTEKAFKMWPRKLDLPRPATLD